VSEANLDRRALALFEELAELAEDERTSRLASACAGDVALRRAVERLFAADRDASRMIASEPRRALAPPPNRIGPYRLAELIGAGGMGAVYRGEREDGLFEQTVAVKLVRPGVLSARSLAQFSAERRILARLEHPQIARLLDGGVDADGHSYIVMEHVVGVSLADWAACEPRMRARLEVFLAVCGAVQFAHQQLVVHADLKPSNVLVTPEGAPKLLDFGIARWLGSVDSGEAPTPALTPTYAAPERAAGAAPTVAGDVYSLGVMLAELCGAEPRGEIPESVRPTLLRDDLRAIVACARAADPAARYQTSAALGADVARALADRVVHARVTGPATRARKLLRRRRWQAAALGGLVAAAAVSSALYVRAERSRREADARFADVRELATYQIFSLYDGLQAVPGAMRLRMDVVERAQVYLDRLAGTPNAPLEVRVEAAAGFARLASVRGVPTTPNLGQPGEAKRNLARGRALLEAVLAEAPEHSAARIELAQILVHEVGSPSGRTTRSKPLAPPRLRRAHNSTLRGPSHRATAGSWSTRRCVRARSISSTSRTSPAKRRDSRANCSTTSRGGPPRCVNPRSGRMRARGHC
jgi:serine/threonine-protein kinase